MKILYVEDNATDADLVRRYLTREAGYAIHMLSTLKEAYACLEAPHDFDLILSDLRLTDGSGLDLLGWIRERNLALAVVIVTGSGDQEAAVAALKTGADDYVIKQNDYVRNLPHTLQAALVRHHDEAARKTRPLHVLYAEHNAFDADLTRRHLTQYAPHIHLEVVENVAQVITRLAVSDQTNYDLLLFDYQLPGLSALEAIKILRQDHHIALPMVLVTGQGNEELAVQALRMGFSDYLVKQPGYLYQLPFALESAFHRAVLTRERAALKQSQRRYEELVTRIPVGIYRFCLLASGEMEFEYVSPRFCEMLGLTQAVLLADVEQAFAQVHPEEIQEFKRLHSDTRNSLAPLTWEGRFVVNGQIHWLHIESTPTQSDGDIILDGVVMDVTERRETEEQLRLAAAVFENTQDGVVITNITPELSQ